MDQKRKNVEDKQELQSKKEKIHSEELHWMHVIADQIFQEDAKKTFIEEDAQEDLTDVLEDVWEKLAQFVQNLNVFHKTVIPHVPKLFWKHVEEYKELEELSTEEELLKQLQ